MLLLNVVLVLLALELLLLEGTRSLPSVLDLSLDRWQFSVLNVLQSGVVRWLTVLGLCYAA